MVKKYRYRPFCQLLLVLAGICILSGCKKKNEKIQTDESPSAPEISISVESSSHSETTTGKAETDTDSGSDEESSSKNSSVKMNTYTKGKISIQYPSILHMKNAEKTAAIDSLIKDNALSVISAYPVDESADTLSITCRVLSANSNRITITYKGYVHTAAAADPVQLFYSNTIDVEDVKNIGFSRYADPYTMAGYVMSDDCYFLDQTAEQAAQLRSWLHTEGTLQSYTTMFKQADFPFDSEFPSSFSYEDGGDICFSVPVSHDLGDYAIVVYTPDTK